MIVTIGNITSSPPGVSLVYFRVPLTFTASNNIADDLVAINVTTCVNAANVSLKGYIDRSAPNITQNKTTYQINQPSSSEKKSCCGGDIPPPCCAVGSIKVSNTSCGKDFHFYFERNKHSINKMIHTVCAAVFALKASAENSQQCPRPFISLLDTGQNLVFFFFFLQHFTQIVLLFLGCLPGFHFVTGRSCVPCPSDTYQDEQGQKSCKTCPANTVTFGKTRMTSKANCTGMGSNKTALRFVWLFIRLSFPIKHSRLLRFLFRYKCCANSRPSSFPAWKHQLRKDSRQCYFYYSSDFPS